MSVAALLHGLPFSRSLFSSFFEASTSSLLGLPFSMGCLPGPYKQNQVASINTEKHSGSNISLQSLLYLYFTLLLESFGKEYSSCAISTSHSPFTNWAVAVSLASHHSTGMLHSRCPVTRLAKTMSPAPTGLTAHLKLFPLLLPPHILLVIPLITTHGLLLLLPLLSPGIKSLDIPLSTGTMLGHYNLFSSF